MLLGGDSVNKTTQLYYIHNDHLGTPKALTDDAGQLVWKATASPFGKATVNNDVDGDGSAVEFNIRHPGQYYDAESGLFYNYFRYYDAETGRYVTSDPIGLNGGINTYAYVENNPLNYIDPLGLCPWCLPLIPPAVEALGYAAGSLAIGLGLATGIETGIKVLNEANDADVGETSGSCPTGSKPINETDWSGDHQGIKEAIGADPKDDTRIDPNGNVWGQNPNGSWTNHGPASDYTGSGSPSGRRGRDRNRRW